MKRLPLGFELYDVFEGDEYKVKKKRKKKIPNTSNTVFL